MTFKLSSCTGPTVRVQLLRDVPFTKYDYRINNAADVDRLVGEELRHQDREHLLVIYLNSRRQVIEIEVAAIGTMTDMYVAPREVFKGAILANACEIILVHNHPSGDVTPSNADERIIYEMIESGRMMKIPMRDFVIIGNGYFSHYEYCSA
jgi:DNA repair protein RadC